MGLVKGFSPGAIVGKAIAQGDSLEGMRSDRKGGGEQTQGQKTETQWMTRMH